MKISSIFLTCFLGLFLCNCGNPFSSKDVQSDEYSMESQSDNSESSDNVSSEIDDSVVKLKVTNIEDGTKVLWNQAGNTYHAVNMFDENPATGWAIRLSTVQEESDRIYGPSMNVNARKLNYIVIQNGYGKNRDSFLKNTRAKSIRIYRITDDEFPEEEDIIYEGPLKDTMEPQILKVNPDYNNLKPTKMVQITMPHYTKENYYMGSKWDDLVISELEFYGIPIDSNISSTLNQTDSNISSTPIQSDDNISSSQNQSEDSYLMSFVNAFKRLFGLKK